MKKLSKQTNSPYLSAFVFLFLAVSARLSASIIIPILPEIVVYFHSTTKEVQLVVSIYMLTLACSQLFFGSLVDLYGRRRIILFGYGIFFISSILMASTRSFDWLIVARIFQGIGLGAGVVALRSSIRDTFKGKDFLRVVSLMSIFIGTSPYIGLIVASILLTISSWLSIFHLILIYSIIMLAFAYFFFPEIEIKKHSFNNAFTWSIKHYRILCSHSNLMTHIIATAITFALMIGFLFKVTLTLRTSQPHNLNLLYCLGLSLLIGHIASYFTNLIFYKHRYKKIVMAYALFTITSVAMVIASSLNDFPLWLYYLFSLIFSFSAALATPNITQITYNFFPHHKGMTSALLGFLQMLISAFIVIIIGRSNLENLSNFSYLFLTLSIILCILTFFIVKCRPKKPEALNE